VFGSKRKRLGLEISGSKLSVEIITRDFVKIQYLEATTQYN
jgi:hypothetical protein